MDDSQQMLNQCHISEFVANKAESLRRPWM